MLHLMEYAASQFSSPPSRFCLGPYTGRMNEMQLRFIYIRNQTEKPQNRHRATRACCTKVEHLNAFGQKRGGRGPDQPEESDITKTKKSEVINAAVRKRKREEIKKRQKKLKGGKLTLPSLRMKPQRTYLSESPVKTPSSLTASKITKETENKGIEEVTCRGQHTKNSGRRYRSR
jgi:hypothetical protein